MMAGGTADRVIGSRTDRLFTYAGIFVLALLPRLLYLLIAKPPFESDYGDLCGSLVAAATPVRAARAGLWLGATVLTRMMALPLIPLAAAIKWRSRGWRAAMPRAWRWTREPHDAHSGRPQ